MLVQANPESLMKINDDGNTPLHRACHFGMNLEVVRMFLDKSIAPTTVRNKCGTLAIQAAYEIGCCGQLFAIILVHEILQRTNYKGLFDLDDIRFAKERKPLWQNENTLWK